MEVKIQYLYHSCFSLHFENVVLLFDYPGREVKEPTEKKLESKLKGKKLFVFVSHAHGDHFSPEVTKFSNDAEETYFLLSDDVPASRFGKEEVIEVAPNESYRIEDMKIKTFKSNDAGVAFLILLKNATIYYGGDLAKWDWPEWSEKKRKEHVEVFNDVVDSLKKEDIDIAFSNMDERLPSWSGPVEFIERVKPTYFVPMHTFGSEEWIDDLVNKGWEAETKIFHYSKQGDEVTWKI